MTSWIKCKIVQQIRWLVQLLHNDIHNQHNTKMRITQVKSSFDGDESYSYSQLSVGMFYLIITYISLLFLHNLISVITHSTYIILYLVFLIHILHHGLTSARLIICALLWLWQRCEVVYSKYFFLWGQWHTRPCCVYSVTKVLVGSTTCIT